MSLPPLNQKPKLQAGKSQKKLRNDHFIKEIRNKKFENLEKLVNPKINMKKKSLKVRIIKKTTQKPKTNKVTIKKISKNSDIQKNNTPVM